ncbi:MAG: cupredoxin domain-containing protein [Thermomicrobiales bacterium]
MTIVRRMWAAIVGLGLIGALGFGGAATGGLAATQPSPAYPDGARADDAGIVIHMVEQPDNADAQYVFSPAQMTVPVGATVQWVNDTTVLHTVTATDSLDLLMPNGLYDQAVSNAGDTVSYTFDTPGTYFYFCFAHTDYMTGTITVTG